MQHAHQLIYYYFNKVLQLWARMTFIVSFITWFNWLQQQINSKKKTHRRNTLSIHFRAFFTTRIWTFFLFQQRSHTQHDVEHETRNQIEIFEKLRRLIIDRTRENQWIFNLRVYWFIESNKISKQNWVCKIWFWRTTK